MQKDVKSESPQDAVITPDAMRALEQAAIASGQVTGLELMERAGRGVFEAVSEVWPKLTGPAYVLCGPGNNGGDGYVIARLLDDAGWQVQVFQYGNPDSLPPDAKVNYERWRAQGAVSGISDSGKFVAVAKHEAALWIDALFGIGLTRGLGADLWPLVRSLNECTADCHVVAVDVPSGLNAATGEIPQARTDADPIPQRALTADLTVTFHRLKPGHVTGQGPLLCGQVVVKDIGL